MPCRTASSSEYRHAGRPVDGPRRLRRLPRERRFMLDKSDWTVPTLRTPTSMRPVRYNLRARKPLTPAEIERVRGGSRALPLLQRVVGQFVIHYDVANSATSASKVLRDQQRPLCISCSTSTASIYQDTRLEGTRCRTWARPTRGRWAWGNRTIWAPYPPGQSNALAQWYQCTNGQTVLTIPKRFGDGGLRTE